MIPENWNRIQELFLATADLPASERDLFLARVCDGDAELRAEVEALLRADRGDSSVITTAVESELSDLLEGDTPLPGTRLGAYRVLKEIGRGGMGTVYLGERDDQHYRKLVAIKVVKRGMDSAEVVARFRHERQILAALEHPYIARLIDGGTTPDGRPFFIMEHVEGRPIDTYCRENALNIESRLRLLLRVCEAVAYAHRSLIVHRDLKPSNILVTGDGVPKLLDFGVAKLLDAGGDLQLTSTQLGTGPLTPEYASPEQVRGLAVTTATDVYAFGAIFFEILTGTKAQKISTYTPAEIERVVCQDETRRPSSVGLAAETPLRLGSDIDNIVMMAMRKEPERRYASMDQMAEDIVRYLERRPVLARQDSFGYRARKFVRRNSLAVAATILIFMSLLGGIGAALMQAHRADTARDIAEVQRRSAERERARAESAARVAEQERARAEAEKQTAKTEQDRAERRLTEMIELSNRSLHDVHSAIEKLPGGTDARRQIVVTTLKFLEDLSRDAGDDDRLRFALSVSYGKVAKVQGNPTAPNLGDTTGAIANYEKSLAFLKPLLAREPENWRYLLQWIDIQTDLGIVLAKAGQEQRALADLRPLVPAAQRLPRLCRRDLQCQLQESYVCSALVNILVSVNSGEALQYTGLQIRSLERVLNSFPDEPDVRLELATAYSQQARVENIRGNLREAADSYQHAIRLRESALQRNPTDVVVRRNLMITYGNLAGNLGSPFFLNLGDPAGARENYAKALAIARELARADASNELAQYDLANALLGYATLEFPKEDWPGSLANLQEAERILQKLISSDAQSVPNLRTLARVKEYEGRRLEGLGKVEEALLQYRESLTTAEKLMARSPSNLVFVTQRLVSEEAIAELLAHQGDRPGALEMAQDAVTRAEHASAPKSEHDRVERLVARAHHSMATVRALLGDWSEARAAAERAVAGWQQLVASNSRGVDATEAARAQALLQECNAHLSH